jgi:beta-glucosidase/6-phospho-beta-glucosidase/beta-galactosidase/ABC-type amino acid transport substrate-binding protein
VELPELLFGVATADHQSEAFDPKWPDYRDRWEEQQKQTLRGRATDFWNRYEEDIQLARGLGCKLFRFSVSWARVEPSAGLFDNAALNHYRRLAECVLRAGMQPLVTLHHFTWPIHVEERGGMTAQDFPKWYGTYVEQVAAAIGDIVQYWITFNEPNLLVYGYVKPWWQPSWLVPPGASEGTFVSAQLDRAILLIRNLFLAHRIGREVIRRVNRAAKVGVNPFVLGLPPGLQQFIDWLATRTTRHQRLVELSRSMAEQLLLSRTAVDVVIARFTPTAERWKHVVFSEAYTETDQRMVLKRGRYLPNETAAMRIGFVRGSTALKTIEQTFPDARTESFATHREGLISVSNATIHAFVADEICIDFLDEFPDLELRPDSLARFHYAVGMARGNPDLLSIVNAVVRGKTIPQNAAHLRSFRTIRRRGRLRVGIGADPNSASRGGISRQEVELARKIAKQILGSEEKVDFRIVHMEERLPVLTSYFKWLEPLLKMLSVIGTFLTSNWWHLGMAGQLPEFMCPPECVGQQDFLGLDYYWGISKSEPHRLHQLIEASQSNFENAPADPPGLFKVLQRFHRWFPHQELLIIENGCIAKADGFNRAEYLRAHLDEVERARAAGVPVRAYIYWSITSNREWGLKFTPASDFGLYHIELDTDAELKRVRTESADVFESYARKHAT